MKNWEIESIEAQRDFVILGMKNKKDNKNLMLHYLHHSFSHVYTCMNVGAYAKHFSLEGLFSKYDLSQFWTVRKLTAFALNILKYNSVVAKANKKPNVLENHLHRGQEVLELHPSQCLL